MAYQISTQGTGEIRFTKLGFPTERGHTLECRRNFYTGCRKAPKSARPLAYATFATLLIRHCSWSNGRQHSIDVTTVSEENVFKNWILTALTSAWQTVDGQARMITHSTVFNPATTQWWYRLQHFEKM